MHGGIPLLPPYASMLYTGTPLPPSSPKHNMPPVGCTHPPVQQVKVVFFLGLKQPWDEAVH